MNFGLVSVVEKEFAGKKALLIYLKSVMIVGLKSRERVRKTTMRYAVYKFDRATFVVFDTKEKREICVCTDYDDNHDAQSRAKMIRDLLNSL